MQPRICCTFQAGLELLEICLPLPISAGTKGVNHHSWLVACFSRSTLCCALRGRIRLPTWPWSLRGRVYWGNGYMDNSKGKESYQDGAVHLWESPESSISRVKVDTFSHSALYIFYLVQSDRIQVGLFVCLLFLIECPTMINGKYLGKDFCLWKHKGIGNIGIQYNR